MATATSNTVTRSSKSAKAKAYTVTLHFEYDGTPIQAANLLEDFLCDSYGYGDPTGRYKFTVTAISKDDFDKALS